MENEKYLKVTSAVYSLLDLFPDEDPLKNRAKEKALAVLDSLISVSFLPSPEKEKSALQAINEIEMLLGCLNLANCQGFLTKLNLIIITEEYNKIIKEIKPIADAHKQDAQTPRVEEKRKWTKLSELLPVATAPLPAPEKEMPPKKISLVGDKVPTAEPSRILDADGVEHSRQSRNEVGKSNSGRQASLPIRQEKIMKILEEKGKAQVADLKQILTEVTKRTLRRDLDDLLKKEKIVRVGEWNQTFYQIRTS